MTDNPTPAPTPHTDAAPSPHTDVAPTQHDAPPVVPPPTPSDATLAVDLPADDASGGAITVDQARIVLRRVKDPELNLNIVDLGLVYDVAVEGTVVKIDMSLTSPGCPSGPEIMGEAEQQLRTIPGVSDVVVNLIWSPPWTPERIEPRVRAYMGF
jgi:metal-sulfur cluster biosynthetic enzyme